MDHLQKAMKLMEKSETKMFAEQQQVAAQQALAHAVIALVQRVDQLIEAQALPRYVIMPPSDED